MLILMLVHFDTSFVGLPSVRRVSSGLFVLVMAYVVRISIGRSVIVIKSVCGLKPLRLRACLEKLLALVLTVSDLATKVKI